MYGYNVICSDGAAEYVFYAKFSNNENEAKNEFRLAMLEEGLTLQIIRIEEATKFQWEHFDIHGDSFHSPNAKYGKVSGRKKPQTAKRKESRYEVAIK